MSASATRVMPEDVMVTFRMFDERGEGSLSNNPRKLSNGYCMCKGEESCLYANTGHW